MGNEDQALKEYDAALALDPEYTPVYLDKAKLFYAQRRYPDAAALCRAALAHLPEAAVPATARDTHGSALLDKVLPTGREAEPPKTYRQEAAYDLALCLKAQGQFRKRLPRWPRPRTPRPPGRTCGCLKARLQEAGGDLAGSLATLQLLRADFPEMAEIPKRLAALLPERPDKRSWPPRPGWKRPNWISPTGSCRRKRPRTPRNSKTPRA